MLKSEIILGLSLNACADIILAVFGRKKILRAFVCILIYAHRGFKYIEAKVGRGISCSEVKRGAACSVCRINYTAAYLRRMKLPARFRRLRGSAAKPSVWVCVCLCCRQRFIWTYSHPRQEQTEARQTFGEVEDLWQGVFHGRPRGSDGTTTFSTITAVGE